MNTDYQNLLDSINGLFAKIESSIDDDERRQNVLAYWTIGKMVYEYKEEVGTSVQQVARDLGLAPQALQHYTNFFKTYSKGYPEEFFGRVLGWSDFRAVLAVHDKVAREWYLKETCRQNWGSHELRRRVNNNFYESVCGVSSLPITHHSLRSVEQQLYTYSARVLKVVDADTLKVEVDVGFSMRYETKLRLRGINCPEKKTKRGQEAKVFVEEELGWGKNIENRGENIEAQKVLGSSIFYDLSSIIVLKTYKTEKYGRFLADVWYLKGETNPEEILKNGHFLNQILLDKGFAQKME